MTCVELFHIDFIATRWQVFLVYEAYNLLYLAAILYGTRSLPIINHIGGKRFLSTMESFRANNHQSLFSHLGFW